MAVLLLPASAFAERDAKADVLAENATRERAERFLSEKGIEFEHRSLIAGRGGFGVSLHALIRSRGGEASGKEAGERPSLVVAAPLGSSGRGAFFGTEAALLFAERVKREGLPIDVRVALLADESSELPADLQGEFLLGYRDLAELYEDPERVAIVYLDLGNEARSPAIGHGAAGMIAPLGLLRSLMGAFTARGFTLPVAVPYNELYRLHLVAGSKPLAFLNEAGFQALYISNSSLPAFFRPSSPISPGDFSAALFDFAHEFAESPVELDRRYTIFPLGFRIATVPESVAVAFFLLSFSIGLATLLVYSITHRHLMLARSVIFLRRTWALGLFLFVLFSSFICADFLLSLSFRISGSVSGGSPYGRASVKLLLALAFYFSFSPLLNRRPVPRRAHYYGAAATVYQTAGILIAAAIDFTFVPVFLWAFVCSVAIAAIRSHGAVLVLAALAPLQLVGAAAAAVGSGDDSVARLLFSDDPVLNLYLAFMILPFIFLFRRASSLSASSSGSTYTLRSRWARAILLFGAALTAIVFALNGTLAERDAAPPSRPVLSEASGDGELALRILKVRESDSPFLDRRSFVLTLEAEGRPSRLDLSLESDRPIPIYDSLVPFTLSEDGRKATFMLSERPPDPLSVEIVLPRDFRAVVRTKAVYTDPPPSFPLDVEPFDWALVVETNLEIGPQP